MAVRIFIKRTVPSDKAKEMISLFRQMRQLALQQPGYISGETLRNYNDPNEFLVVSSWNTAADWESWMQSPVRQKMQDKIDFLLGGKTDYDIFHYGFAE